MPQQVKQLAVVRLNIMTPFWCKPECSFHLCLLSWLSIHRSLNLPRPLLNMTWVCCVVGLRNALQTMSSIFSWYSTVGEVRYSLHFPVVAICNNQWVKSALKKALKKALKFFMNRHNISNMQKVYCKENIIIITLCPSSSFYKLCYDTCIQITAISAHRIVTNG